MASRGRPPGREYTVKVEVWVSGAQSDELDAFCELHLGVKRAEVLRRALAAFIKAQTGTPAKRAEFDSKLREGRLRKSVEPKRAGLRSIPGGTGIADPGDESPA